MKIRFKHQAFQKDAVQAVVDCFEGQPYLDGIRYRIDPGRQQSAAGVGAYQSTMIDDAGFKNERVLLPPSDVLKRIQQIQQRQYIPVSTSLIPSAGCQYNLDIEMETGTGKTYCYIKTIFELHRRFGWSKYIIVVPSIAIREGVHKSFEITADHFLEDYGKRVRYFIYNSKRLHELESFSSDGGINVMIINIQAFASRGQDAKRIYEVLDEFNSRKPIDVVSANNPILILDEPQKMEGAATLESLARFKPLMILRYSATHRTQHNKIYRLDALDAYNQKLVKKIAVTGITTKGLPGTNAYLYLEGIEISRQAPVARMEMEVKTATGIKRQIRKVSYRDNLYELSNRLDQYDGFVVSQIDAREDKVSFTNGHEISGGEATGNVEEGLFRRLQIREAIRAHLSKERELFQRGIKVLSLFFIDEVAKYRQYENGTEKPGEYATYFEEEYSNLVNEPGTLDSPAYRTYLEGIHPSRTHNGYFSIDKKTNQLKNPEMGKKAVEADDVDAYDLILRKKEQLLSFAEPTRFIFSHSALREGWDNPNVFVICTLKHSDNSISRRQEVGRGMRLSVDKDGNRQDDPSTVHDINILTVVASESYKDFVNGLQQDIKESLSERPRKANADYFEDKPIHSEEGSMIISTPLAVKIYQYLVKNDYVDEHDQLTTAYQSATVDGTLAILPEALIPYSESVHRLIGSVLSETALPVASNARTSRINPLNENFHKQEFKELWNRINKKAIYTVHFDSQELITNAIIAINAHLHVQKLVFIVETGAQLAQIGYEEMQAAEGFTAVRRKQEDFDGILPGSVKYDLIGKIAEQVTLTRNTIASILKGIKEEKFRMFGQNPEQFISEVSRIINEQKASVIIEKLQYDTTDETFDSVIFTEAQARREFNPADKPLNRHIFDYVVTDSTNEKAFVSTLDIADEVVVYAKLPNGFKIPTPVGDYNPDWAIAFKEGAVRHVYFVAETKGSMSSMQLRKIEESKIACAKKFFAEISRRMEADQVKYDVVDSYESLMRMVKG